MYTFHFQNFVGQLDIQAPYKDGDLPKDAPIFLFYREESNLSKHEILKRFLNILKKNNLSYLKPLQNLTGEWLFDLDDFKNHFECLKKVEYLKGTITLDPTYSTKEAKSTELKFVVKPNELHLTNADNLRLPHYIEQSNHKFKKDFPDNKSLGFLMMKFEDSPQQKSIIETLKSFLESKGIQLLRADDKWYSDDLFQNICTYMNECSFGIALFERINTEEFNPNVSFEIGYMMALKKPVLLLKEKTLKSLQSDLVGKLYHQFDFQSPSDTIPIVLEKWLKDMDIL